MLSSNLEIHSTRSPSIAQFYKEDAMDYRDKDVGDLDARATIRLNSLIELKYFVMALVYQHKFGNINANSQNESQDS